MNNNCIFCKIVSGEIPAEKVFENNDFLCFMDIRPLSPGHCLVIPKKHYHYIYDVPNGGEYFEFAKQIALAQKKAFNIDIVVLKAVGEEVPHAHIWLVPDESKTIGDKKDLKGNAEKIKIALSQ